MAVFTGKLSDADKAELQAQAKRSRGNILKMTSLAASGHPGGAMSTLDMVLTVYKFANISKDNYTALDRDRIFISHGHTSGAQYTALSEKGFFDVDRVVSEFRLAGSIFEGHIERMVPGVEWTTGNLGQGISAACGAAHAGRITGNDYQIYVFMGDGEQQKGQLGEARRDAAKHGLKNITAFLDYNKLQISGDIKDVMPQGIKEGYLADGWDVIEIDGHDFDQIYDAIVQSHASDKPTLVLANTIMGKGVSFMENIAGYHGKPLTEDQLADALKELGEENNLEELKKLRSEFKYNADEHKIPAPKLNVKTGTPRTYAADEKTDNRSAFGNALTDIVLECNKDADATKIAVFDCDLAGSVKTDGVLKNSPENFIQTGIQEHHTCVAAGAASVNGVVSFFADFGVFGVDETYNQQRLNDINEANLKTCTTHVGLDVGEDGKTHQCIDYVGAARNIYGQKIICPADPNQTDRAVRYAAGEFGNYLVAMGRSKLTTITDEEGKPFFGDDYKFEYGKMDIVRDGDIAMVAYGPMVNKALEVRDILAEKGISIAVINAASPAHPNLEDMADFFEVGLVFTYEDHNINTGIASVMALELAKLGGYSMIVPFGPEKYGYSGKPDDILKLMEIDPASVADKIIKTIASLEVIEDEGDDDGCGCGSGCGCS